MRQNQVRNTLLGLVTGGALIACGSAWGDVLPQPSANACTAGMTVQQFANFGSAGCSEGDKNYVYLDSSNLLGTTAIIDVTELTLPNGDIQHNFIITFNDGVGVPAPFTASIDYTVEINDLAVNIAGIDQVRFDTTTGINGTGGATSTSVIQEFNPAGPTIILSSTDGSAQGALTVGEPHKLQYGDTFNVAGNGSLTTAQDTLVETLTTNLTPEPASLALVGLGLTVLGFARRRKTS